MEVLLVYCAQGKAQRILVFCMIKTYVLRGHVKGDTCIIPEFDDKNHGNRKLADHNLTFDTNSIAFAVRKPTCGTDSDVTNNRVVVMCKLLRRLGVGVDDITFLLQNYS